ncbi:MAG TPA: ribonuclease HI [Gaiellaceae bacterium]
MKQVELWTDGSCSGNPGPGGWAAILRFGAHERELTGSEPDTTNNRMELLAAIGGLEAIRERCEVALHTDSAYLINAFEQRWIAGWLARDWRTTAKKPVENRDLWERLIELAGHPGAAPGVHRVRFVKVAGHAGVVLNERCDRLAVEARDRGRYDRQAASSSHASKVGPTVIAPGPGSSAPPS